MDANDATPTVNASLEGLSDALLKASEDLTEVHGAIELAREDMSKRNTTVSRQVVVAATRAIDHLRLVDEALRDVLKALEERD